MSMLSETKSLRQTSELNITVRDARWAFYVTRVLQGNVKSQTVCSHFSKFFFCVIIIISLEESISTHFILAHIW